MLGFDVSYKNNYGEKGIVIISNEERRTILTKDRNLLKRNDVSHGYWVRNTDVTEQVKEVTRRFQLNNLIIPFSRCMKCNSILESTEKGNIEEMLEKNTKELFDEFYKCPSCGQVYWKGSHYQKMLTIINEIKES